MKKIQIIILVLFIFSSLILYHSFNVSVENPYKVIYSDEKIFQWEYIADSYSEVYFRPYAVVYDIDSDGADDFIIASFRKGTGSFSLYAFSGLGYVLWVRNYTSNVSNVFSGLAGSFYPSVSSLLIFFSVGKTFYAVSGENGSVFWSTDIETSNGIPPVLGDVDSDGVKEIVYVGVNNLYLIEPFSGEIVFNFTVRTWVDSLPVIGDIDGDSLGEIIIIDIDYNVIALNNDGSILWNKRLNANSTYVPNIRSFLYLIDIDFDDELEIVGAVEETRYEDFSSRIYTIFFSLDGVSGELLSFREIGRGIRFAAPAPIFIEDKFFLVFESRGHLYFFDVVSGGIRPLDVSNTEIGISFGLVSLIIGDFDGDNRSEIYYPTDSFFVTIVDLDNRRVLNYLTDTIITKCHYNFVGDFDRDGLVEIGFLSAFSVAVVDLPNPGFRVYWRGRGLNDNNFNLALVDSDFDGLSDFSESIFGTNASDLDSDGDGLPDVVEIDNGLDPLEDADALLDIDGDGVKNVREYKIGTRLSDGDTDSDGFSDNIDPFPTNSLRPATEIWIISMIGLIVVTVFSLMRKNVK